MSIVSLLLLVVASSSPPAPAPASAAAPAASAAVPAPAAAPATITIIVPWHLAGSTGPRTKLFAKPFSSALGRPVEVKGVPGGEGTVGALEAKRAPPDGATLFAVQEGIHGSYHAGIGADVSYRDFEPVCMISTTPSAYATFKAAPWHSLKELIDDARKRPGMITFGGTKGSSSWLVPMLLQQAAGVQFTYLPIEGTTQRIAQLAAGKIDFAEVNMPSPGGEHDDTLRTLAMASDERLPTAPTLPTVKESGYDISYALYRGLLAPKGTPVATLDWLEAGCAKAAKDAEHIRGIEVAHGKITFLGRKQYKEFLDKTDATIVGYLKKVGAFVR